MSDEHELWRRAIDLGRRKGMISSEMAAEAMREVNAHAADALTPAQVCSWAKTPERFIEGLLDLARAFPADPEDSFQNLPFVGMPREDWNRHDYWQPRYQQLAALPPDSRERDPARSNNATHIWRVLGGWSRPVGPPTALDAGCGVSLIPALLAYMGFDVTAIDLCTDAIRMMQALQTSEERLCRCASPFGVCNWWDIRKAEERAAYLERALTTLRAVRGEGGTLQFLVGNWNDPVVLPGPFQFIHCANALNQSTRSYWRRSLAAFRRLLVPGGLVLIYTCNVIAIRPEVEDLIAEAGLTPLGTDVSTTPSDRRYAVVWWQTG